MDELGDAADKVRSLLRLLNACLWEEADAESIAHIRLLVEIPSKAAVTFRVLSQFGVTHLRCVAFSGRNHSLHSFSPVADTAVGESLGNRGL